MDLDTAIEELYGLEPAEFTAHRDRLSAEARGRGERELAAAIRALRRPSVAAHTVNLMARKRAEEIGRLTALGAQMREAQAALSGEELRELGRQRSQLVAGLTREARHLARQSGHPITEATEREVQATFEAALADAAAGEAVRAGRLMKALERSGMDPVDLAGAVAGTAAEATQGGLGRDEAARRTKAREDPVEAEQARRDDRRRREAEEKARRAEDEACGANERRSEADDHHRSTRQRRVDAEEKVGALEERLAQARRDLDDAVEAERLSRRTLLEAEEYAERAAAAAQRARAEVDSS